MLPVSRRYACRAAIQALAWIALLISPGLHAGPSQQRAPQAGPLRRADASLQAALAAYRSGKLDDAIARLREAHAAAPDHPDVRLYLGLFLYEKSRDSLEAQRLMESVADQYPGNSELQLRLLDSYLIARNERKSSALLERIRPKMEADTRFAFNVVHTLVYHGRMPAAQAEVDRISRSLQGEILFLRGLIALGNEERDKALQFLQDAGRLGFPPDDSSQKLTLAECFFRLRQFPEAAKAYEAYLLHQGDLPVAHRLQFGLSCFAFGDFNRSLEQLTAVNKAAPETPEILLYVGTVLIELKRMSEARAPLLAEVKRNPASFRATTKLAYLEYLAGDDAACRQWLEKSLSLNPRWFEAHMVYGLLYNRLGEYDKAVKSLEACAREEPEYPKAHFQLSLAYRRLGEEAKADESLERFNKLQGAATARALEALGLNDRARTP